MRESAALLLDVGCLCESHTDAALESIFKAVGEDPPDDDLWAPHPNPYVRNIVEMISARGLRRVAGLEAELRRWLGGAEFDQSALVRPARPVGAMIRWSVGEIGLVRAYLRALPPGAWTLDDWMLLIDFLVQRYLPESDMRSEAEWLASRSNLMGRAQAAMGDADPLSNAQEALAAAALADAAAALGMTREQRAGLDFGVAHCAEHCVAWSETSRRRLRNTILNWQEATYLGDKAGAAEGLQTVLLDNFGTMNRDWRRIAVTEATENAAQGFVAAAGPGAKVRRVEKYRGACKHCREIDGKVFTVVDAGAAEKDGATQVWVGKTNLGRSASPHRREGNKLVPREAGAMWWCAAGAQHPNCRGSWVNVGGASEDPEFEAWLADLKRRKRGGVDGGV